MLRFLLMRRFWLVGGLALAVAAACDSGAGLTTPGGPIATPTSSSSSSSGSSSGDDDGGVTQKPDPEGWGDPKTVRRPGKLRLEQLNLRRFFDTKCDSGSCSADGYEAQATQEQFDARVKQIADDLATIQADVITFAEVENQGCLDAVQKSLKAAGFEYPVAYVAETGAPGSIDVALLARGKMDSVINYRDSTPLVNGTGKFTREFPEIHLTIGKNKVVVFPAHFRSKSNDDPARRLGEAETAHDIMVKTGGANRDAALVLLGGDLNDTPGSDPINALEGDGKLVRVAKDVALQGTYKFGGTDQPIDHIFITKELADAYVPKSATVVRDPGDRGFAGSDHATLWADFTLPE